MQEEKAAAQGILTALDCVPTINFAMQQNDVPIVRQLRVTNQTEVAIQGLRVRLSSEPESFPPREQVLARIAPRETLTLGPIDLRLSAAYLGGLTERIAGSIHVDVTDGDGATARHTQPIEMLAFNEWNGMAYSLPELLAAFVLPNHPVVEAILKDAAKWLGENTGDSSLSGYQTRSATRIGQIVQAIYVAIQARGINYCNPPASFEQTGQKIRLPDRILESKLATCLDLAVLMAGCLEQAGMYPLVVMTRGHAFAGVWLTDECFADCMTDEALLLRKRVDLGEILVLETTLLTAPPPNDLPTAITTARRHLADEGQFEGVIDIQRCRKSRIRPLPIRMAAEPASDVEAAGQPSGPTAVINLEGVVGTPAQPKAVPETPATRLDKWKRKLLDLTLFNRLINFKPSKKTIPLMCPGLTTLEDALADGEEFRVLPPPADFAEGSARSEELHYARTGTDALDQLLAEELQSRRLHAKVPEEDLNRRLTEIYRGARTAVEEGGASTLYLALGFLAWYESETSEQRRMAPIILLPVELHRPSIQEGFHICQSDEDPRLNVTLLELLAKDFDLRIPGMDPIPEDEHGVDVHGILTTFRQAIKNTKRWDVIEEAHIGFFSFTKFLMWRDLEERSADLLHSKVVDHLLNRPNEPFPGNGQFPEEGELDKTRSPRETYCPLPSDSSQLAAVYAAASPKTFVLFGPPGTGKSQTITNLIAHSLANNKSVLFVSEKMAALSVVYKRLEQSGLGTFCLELHSNKAQKRHVVEQLGQALDFRRTRAPQDWEQEAAKLAGLRSELNTYVEALHRPRSFGESVFQATSRLIGLRDVQPIAQKFPSPDNITREQRDRWYELIEQMRTAITVTGPRTDCAWWGCGIETWSASIQRAIEADVDALLALCERLDGYIQNLGRPLGLGISWNLSYLEFAEKLVRLLTTAPQLPAGLLTARDWTATEAAINEWSSHGRKRDTLRQALYAEFEERILQLDLDQLQQRLKQTQAAWFLPRWLGMRAVRKILDGVARRPGKLDGSTVGQRIAEALALRDEQKRLGEFGSQAQTLLGTYWKNGEADWAAIDTMRDWCGRYRKYAQGAASGNAEKAAAFRQHWARLVTDGYESLKPQGELGKTIAGFLATLNEFSQTKGNLESRLGADAALWSAEPRRATLADIRAKLGKLKAGRAGLRAWCNWRQVRKLLMDGGLASLVQAYERDGVTAEAVRRRFDRSFYEACVDFYTEREPALQRFFSPEHERKIQQFREVDEQYTRLTRAAIQAQVLARRPQTTDRVNDASELGILQRQRQIRRGHLPVRQLFQKIPHLLRLIKPCVLMSPLSVAQYLDASHPPFDLVVFDEASQIPPWDAVGAIARGQEAVIVGDPKQLPPTNFFMRADEQESGDDGVVEDMESILDECLSGQLPQMQLRWHYRSRHESLIAFSNYHYYQNNLLTFPSPFVGHGVTYRNVATGVYDKGKSRSNRPEAEAVVAEVVKRLRNPQQSSSSIGIVTFSMAQQGLVEDLLDEARREYPEIEPFFGNDVPEPVFIKNLENVQGDERDVILFSICYGPDANGKVSVNFGPLNREGGERRLNVAITRARSEVIVFSTLKAEQIDLGRTRARGVQDLKCFLDYAERGPIAISQAAALRGGDEFESPFEQQVCQKVRDRGYEVHSQVGCSDYRIDLAIVDPETPGRYLLGIECDGANYHSAKTARDRDRLRQEVLAGLGWRLHRIWSSDWWANPGECLSKIEAAVEQAKAARPSEAVSPQVAPAEVSQETTEQEPEPAQEPESAPAAPGSPPHSVYRAYQVKRALSEPQEFYSMSATSRIRQLILEVTQAEGPVALEVVARRVAARWGMTRLGANIRERVADIAGQTAVTQVRHGDVVFLWPRGLNPATYTDFREPGVGENEQRAIDEIAPEEIAVAAIHVLQEQVSLPWEALIRETALLFGYQRAGQTIQRIVGSAIEMAIRQGRAVKNENGTVRL